MDSVETVDRRTQQLASAKKKLSNFRARGSDTQTTFNFPITPLPLTTELSGNCPSPATKEAVTEVGGLDKAFSMNMKMDFKMEPQAHKRQGSTGGHRRRPSSISHPAVPLRTSVTGLFESTTFGISAEAGLDLPNFNSTPPNPPPPNPAPAPPPLLNEDPVTPINNTDDNARTKFTSFSFGSKPPSTPLGTLRTSSPSHSPKPSFSAPGAFNRLSTPLSRPPSLLVTRPTPLPLEQPLSSAPLSSPPSPARKRHSHTRSNSISMPNLKLGRPQSYSVLSSSPSFPSSPVSPDNLADTKINGRKLKFEPSGRGAEAEQQRDESRRKALEKLTGKSPTIRPPLEAAVTEISLPDEDEDNEVDTTPYMLQGEIEGSSLGAPAQFGRYGNTDSPESSDISPIITPSTWQSPTPSSAPAETWTRNADDHLGLGFGMDNTALKRASMPSALGVLTEEDESEDTSRGDTSLDHQEASNAGTDGPAVPPTPSRLRELHLLSSSVSVSPRQETAIHGQRPLSESTPTRPLSVRRPRPLSGLGIGHAAFAASPGTATSTPLGRRRESRGSSISYKKDSDSIGSSTGSSREWSFNRLTSPTSLGGFGSPPASAQFAWPRADINGEIEELVSPIVATSRWAQAPSSSTPTAIIDRGSSDRYSSSMTESSDYSWRDSRLELEMEKEALREDAELWKARCLNAEEHLKAERGETAILRERVRKLGDRLSSVSSSRLPPTQADESRPLAEMRDQMFSLMSLLEREQREKNQALSRISELENQLHESHFQQTANSFQPILPSQAFGRLPPPSPTIIPPTPLPSSPEINGNKMKSWGFPSRSRTPTPPKEKRRESFFGLSSVLKGPEVHEEHTGIDLPPISLPNEQEPMPPSSAPSAAPPLARSNSITSSASSVVNFLGGYLGRGRPSASTSEATRKGVLDLRGGCSCCTGEVSEL